MAGVVALTTEDTEKVNRELAHLSYDTEVLRETLALMFDVWNDARSGCPAEQVAIETVMQNLMTVIKDVSERTAAISLYIPDVLPF